MERLEILNYLYLVVTASNAEYKTALTNFLDSEIETEENIIKSGNMSEWEKQYFTPNF